MRQFFLQYWMGEGQARSFTSSGPYETATALKRALEIKAAGGTDIVLKDVDSGVVADVERFMKDHPDA